MTTELRESRQHQEITDAGLRVSLIPVRTACTSGDKAQSELEDRIAHMVAAAGECETYTATSRTTCESGGRHFNTGYGYDSYCLPCKIRVIASGQIVIWKVAT